MTKKELLSEFADVYYGTEGLEPLIDWFYSKLEDERRTGRQEWERLQLSKIDELESRLKAADEVIKATYPIYDHLLAVEALERYKSLK